MFFGEALVEIKRTHEILKEIHNKNQEKYYKIIHNFSQEIKETNTDITKIEANLREETEQINQSAQQIGVIEIQIPALVCVG